MIGTFARKSRGASVEIAHSTERGGIAQSDGTLGGESVV